MFLNALQRPAALMPIVALLASAPTAAAAQPARAHTDSIPVRPPVAAAVLPRLQRSVVPDVTVLGPTGVACLAAACREYTPVARVAVPPLVQEGRRGTYAMVGLVAGAAVGWGWYAYRCAHHDDCYSPVGGVLLAAAGGALGLVVGLLIAPAPGAGGPGPG